METHLRQYINKTKREVISEIIALLFFVILSFAINAHDSKFNTHMFTHLLPNKIDTNILSKLGSIIDYDDFDYGDRPKSMVTDALSNICSNNLIGNALFTRFIAEMARHKGELPPEQKIKIINLGTDKTTKDEGSRYSHTTYTVKINLNMYNDDGTGTPGREYYGVDSDGNIIHKPKSLIGSLFHEFTHCLHHIENPAMYYAYRMPDSLHDSPWTNKEERRTISGYINDEIYDPICDHMFDYFQSISKSKTFVPRYSHWGYDSNEQEKNQDQRNRKRLQKYLKFDKKLMDQ